MDEFITLTEYNWAFWVAGLFAIAEFLRWLFTNLDFFFKIISKVLKLFGIKITIKTRGTIEREKQEARLNSIEKSIAEIKDTSKHNVNMFLDHERQVVDRFTDIKDEIVSELNKLHAKVDSQSKEIAENRKESDETDRAMLRDRLNSGMRYFSQNKDEQGRVHISLADYETLDGLFAKYFSKKGNGPFEKMYKDEFKKFIIDR